MAESGRDNQHWKLKEGTRPTTDKDVRRFALFVVEQMLRDREFGELETNELMARAAFTERGLYELAKQDRIICEPLDEEVRLHEVRASKFNCLLLSLQPSKEEPSQYKFRCITNEVRSLYAAKKAAFMKEEMPHGKAGSRSHGTSAHGLVRNREHINLGQTAPKRVAVLPRHKSRPSLPRKRRAQLVEIKESQHHPTESH